MKIFTRFHESITNPIRTIRSTGLFTRSFHDILLVGLMHSKAFVENFSLILSKQRGKFFMLALLTSFFNLGCSKKSAEEAA